MRFFVDQPLQVGQSLTLPEAVAHHWLTVLRAQVGDQAVLFNGQGGEYAVQLLDVHKKTATVQVLAHDPNDRILPVAVTLGLVMSKGDRMDYALQKSTELGVAAIQLLTSERGEMRLRHDRDQKKLAHWRQVLIAACEQCGLNRVPLLHPPMPLSNWPATLPDGLRLMMAPSGQPLALPEPLPERIVVLVGPEGGLSETEMQQAEQQGFLRWQLGTRVLRTETAPVVALAVLMAHNAQNQLHVPA